MAADVCISLRHPSAGESSAIAIQLMGIGKPVLVTAGAEGGRLPEAACLRVDSGPAEQEMVEAYMIWLARTPPARREIGACAARHIRENHSLPQVADLYEGILRGCAH